MAAWSQQHRESAPGVPQALAVVSAKLRGITLKASAGANPRAAAAHVTKVVDGTRAASTEQSCSSVVTSWQAYEGVGTTAGGIKGAGAVATGVTRGVVTGVASGVDAGVAEGEGGEVVAGVAAGGIVRLGVGGRMMPTWVSAGVSVGVAGGSAVGVGGRGGSAPGLFDPPTLGGGGGGGDGGGGNAAMVGAGVPVGWGE